MMLLTNDVSLEEITVNNSFSHLYLIAKDRHDLLPQATDGSLPQLFTTGHFVKSF